MQRFMKKDSGFVVEAAKVGDSDINELANWAHAYVVEEKDALTHEVFEALNVRTPEGTKRASHGMYVIKVEGHIFVSQPGAFEDKYSLVQEIPEDVEAHFTQEQEDPGYIHGPRQI